MAGSDAPRTDGDSGLLVPIPEAEPVIGALRMRHDATAARGVPAHVTVLFPFVPREEIRDAVRSAVGDLIAGMPAFDYRFSRVDRFGDSNVHLVPEPAEAFLELMQHIHRRWPEHPPYGGVIETVIPHLTVGDRLAPGEADVVARQAEAALLQHGPITGRADAVWLMTQDPTGRWSTDSVHPLAARAPVPRP
jgi:hypothetical protein